MPPSSTMGFGLYRDSSVIRDPSPPANNTTFIIRHPFFGNLVGRMSPPGTRPLFSITQTPPEFKVFIYR